MATQYSYSITKNVLYQFSPYPSRVRGVVEVSRLDHEQIRETSIFCCVWMPASRVQAALCFVAIERSLHIYGEIRGYNGYKGTVIYVDCIFWIIESLYWLLICLRADRKLLSKPTVSWRRDSTGNKELIRSWSYQIWQTVVKNIVFIW